MFCFPDVVFIAVCACDYIDRVGGINTWGVKNGQSGVVVWVCGRRWR